LARDLFRNEEGVLIITRPAISRRKQRYTSMRVPESVLRRVHQSLTTRRPGLTLRGPVTYSAL
jgi:hypothetical protein